MHSEKSENKNLEINKILIQYPNKSKDFNGKNEFETHNKKQNIINSPIGTIIKCGENNQRTNILNNQEDLGNDSSASDYSLVIYFSFILFIF